MQTAVFGFDDYCSDQIIFNTTRYDVDFRPDFSEESLTSRCSITITNPTDQPASEVPILLYRMMEIDSVKMADHGVEFEQIITPVTDFRQLQVNYTRVYLAEPLQPKKSATLDIYYSGYLHGYAETGMQYVKDKIDPEFTIFRTDAFAYPIVGVPCIRVERTKGHEKYDYRLSVTVPDSLIVANGGRLIGKISERAGFKTYIYENIKPAWRIDVAIAPYEQLEFGQNRIFYFPSDSAGAQNVREAFEKSYNYLTRWWGDLGQRSGFTMIEIPDMCGSQTDVTCIIQTASAFNNEEMMYELYHEVSHIWNVTATESAPPRWEEGLAMFVQYLLAEELDRMDILDEATDRFIDRLRTRFAEKPELAEVGINGYGPKGIEYMSYTSGMIFFRLMYDTVGHKKFGRIVGSFFDRYRDSGASLEEFAHYSISVNKDLAGLFDEWVFTNRYAELIKDGADYDSLLAEARR